MRNWLSMILTGALLLAVRSGAGAAPEATAGARQPSGNAAPEPPPAAPAGLLRAQVALRFDPARQCPELRPAEPEDETVAVVLFRVGPTGVPSEASVRSSSRSESLDALSRECVLKLRFQPATRWGDGSPVDSWQEIAWKWAHPAEHRAAAGTAAESANAATQTGAARAEAIPHEGRVDLHVCVDETGKLARDPTLVRSSGNQQFDEAAIRVAKAASGSYPPAEKSVAPGKPACLHLSIDAEGD